MESIINKKARHNYFLQDSYEAGIVLEGWELKPILKRRVNIDNSHIVIKKGELFLINCLITPEQSTNTHNEINTSRMRKLMLHKKDIMRLVGKVKEQRFTLIPSKIYKKGRFIKVEVCLAKGKQNVDKRQDEKDASIKKELAQILKHKTKSS